MIRLSRPGYFIALLVACGSLSSSTNALEPLRHEYEIYFAYGTSSMVDSGEKVISLIAADFAEWNELNVNVAGFVDADEDKHADKNLPEARAASVARALVGAGIPADRIHIRSRGANLLQVLSDTTEPLNRRVEVRMNFDAQVHELK